MVSDTCIPASYMQQAVSRCKLLYLSIEDVLYFFLLIALLQSQTYKFRKQHISAAIN